MLPGAFAVFLASARAEFLRGKIVEANWDVEDMEARSEDIARAVTNPETGATAPLTMGLVGRSLPAV